ncbi:MAG: hypothetical protein IV088_02660 [Hydrogenophaga sp.]|uniref:hypothetical protein n=1 Tax=Hydrogenophaga sp. TaxID=1904254 RepID=UPI0025C1AF13|nr:hypothetical protein [Hydrogenophaga sp.]MBT9549724.1 hypothetical protein [Hydrogenophaga sp.]
MNTPSALIALCACVISLSACDKKPTTPPTPTLSLPVPSVSGATTGPSTDPSLPPAASVFPPGTTDPALGATDGTRKPAQESDTKPMPGQNNDHSAPLSPAK